MNKTTQDEAKHGNGNTAKAVASIVTASALVAGIQLNPEHASTFGTIASLLIPFVPSAYRGLAEIAVMSVNALGRKTRRKK